MEWLPCQPCDPLLVTNESMSLLFTSGGVPDTYLCNEDITRRDSIELMNKRKSLLIINPAQTGWLLVN